MWLMHRHAGEGGGRQDALMSGLREQPGAAALIAALEGALVDAASATTPERGTSAPARVV